MANDVLRDCVRSLDRDDDHTLIYYQHTLLYSTTAGISRGNMLCRGGRSCNCQNDVLLSARTTTGQDLDEWGFGWMWSELKLQGDDDWIEWASRSATIRPRDIPF